MAKLLKDMSTKFIMAKENTHTVYMIVNVNTNKSFVGLRKKSSTASLNAITQHIKKAYSGEDFDTNFYNDLKDYGIKSFVHFNVGNFPKDVGQNIKQMLVSKFNTRFPNGYNPKKGKNMPIKKRTAKPPVSFIKDGEGIVYMLVNVNEQKCYVGQNNGKEKAGKIGVEARWQCHVNKAFDKKAKGKCTSLHNAIRDFGKKSFLRMEIGRFPLEELNGWESYFIDLFNTLDPFGYNLTTGAGKNMKYSEVSKKRISKGQLGLRKDVDVRLDHNGNPLPKYIHQVKNKKGKINGYIFQSFPKGINNKEYADATKILKDSLSMDVKLFLMKIALQKIRENHPELKALIAKKNNIGEDEVYDDLGIVYPKYIMVDEDNPAKCTLTNYKDKQGNIHEEYVFDGEDTLFKNMKKLFELKAIIDVNASVPPYIIDFKGLNLTKTRKGDEDLPVGISPEKETRHKNIISGYKVQYVPKNKLKKNTTGRTKKITLKRKDLTVPNPVLLEEAVNFLVKTIEEDDP